MLIIIMTAVGFSWRKSQPLAEGSSDGTGRTCHVLRVNPGARGDLLHVLYQLELISDTPSCSWRWAGHVSKRE